jgi:TRAP-type mannitol/chloroaromatic compound transport system substrate-binding protein
VQAAEWLASPLPRTFLSHAPAQRWYGPGLHPAGTVVALSLDRAIWDGLSSADRAIIEACAAEECRLARVERIMRAQMAAHLERPEKWPARAELAPHVMAALRREARRVVAAVAEKDDAARRIAASFFAFRNLLTGPASA